MRKVLSVLQALCLLLFSACNAGGQVTTENPASIAANQPGAGESAPEPARSEPITENSESEAASMTEPEQEPETMQGMAQPLSEEVIRRMAEGGSWQEGSPTALEDLAYLRIPYVDFEGESHLGEMVVRASLAEEVLEIFAELYEAEFPIARMVLIDEYDADDLASMAANNSSGFCSRLILGTQRYSVHSFGAAVDINPVQNPYVVGSEVYPEAAGEYMQRTDVRPGMVVEGDLCYNAFTSRGWSWGGHWDNPDYQHFEKDVG